MDLRIPNCDEYRAQLGDLDAASTLADLLRAEVTARGGCTRAAAVSRLEWALTGLVDDASLRARLSALCRTLEAEGDFSVSKGGALHATPVRAVVLDDVNHRIISSLPTRAVGPLLPGRLEVEGVCRTHRVSPERAGDLEPAITALGGVVLSADDWAGLMRTPTADDAWLRNLTNRIRWHAEGSGSLERDGALDWSTLFLSDDGPRWRRRSDAPSQLWRARSPYGRWLFAWTASHQTPAVVDFISLSDDDAARTVFALAREQEHPVQARVEQHGEECRLFLREWLPRAEYRFLSVLGTCEFVDRVAVWTFAATRLEHVFSTLTERLGLLVIQTEVGE